MLTPQQKLYATLFALVSPKKDWKGPINALVDLADLAWVGGTRGDLVRAVTFYTGSVPSLTWTEGQIHVTAAGYAATVEV